MKDISVYNGNEEGLDKIGAAYISSGVEPLLGYICLLQDYMEYETDAVDSGSDNIIMFRIRKNGKDLTLCGIVEKEDGVFVLAFSKA